MGSDVTRGGVGLAFVYAALLSALVEPLPSAICCQLATAFFRSVYTYSSVARRSAACRSPRHWRLLCAGSVAVQGNTFAAASAKVAVCSCALSSQSMHSMPEGAMVRGDVDRFGAGGGADCCVGRSAGRGVGCCDGCGAGRSGVTGVGLGVTFVDAGPIVRITATLS